MDNARCIACGTRVEPVLDLGRIPLADALFETREQALQARRYPLQAGRCASCSWVQLLQVPDREILFDSDYPYFSSVSESVCQSAKEHAQTLIRERSLDAGSFVLEIASNDGYQLKWFRKAGMNVLGIDAAPRQVAAANALGVTSKVAFFDEVLAEELRGEYGQADVILAKNVVAHVQDPAGFLNGIRRLLKPTGVASIEFPYLGNLLSSGQFDTIYHEHASYLSIAPLDRLLQACDLGIESIEPVKLHGGSLRVNLTTGCAQDNACRSAWIRREQTSGINTGEAWEAFSAQVERQRAAIRETLGRFADQGLELAAYGAAAKGVTLMNVCQLDCQDIEYTVDKNAYKTGRFMAGTGTEIKPPSTLSDAAPDIVLVLAWNHLDEIRSQQREFESAGGRFLVPIPWPELVQPA